MPATVLDGVRPRGLPRRYRLTGVLGAGSTGRVLAARDRCSGADVAVKTHEAGAPGERLMRAGHEAEVLRQVAHPNVVALLDLPRRTASRTSPAGFVVLERVPGCDLATHLLAGPLDTGDVAAVGAQLATALGHVHRRGWLHGDLKPSNVLLDRTGRRPRAVLADFDTAARIGTGYRVGEFTRGTAAYLSPEQARGRPPLPSSDVYALGLVLLEAATGVVAFPGAALDTVAARLLTGVVVPLDLPSDLRALLAAMTAAEAGSRPTAAAVADRLGAIGARLRLPDQ